MEYIDDIAFLANTPAQAKSLLHSLERVSSGIGLHVYANKMEDISSLNVSSLKLVDKFTYLGSSVSSSEIDIITWLAKAWTVIDSLSVTRKSDLTDKMKCIFFQAAIV